MKQIPLKCHRGDCSRTWATISNGVLLVESRHDSYKHYNAIGLDDLIRLMLASRYTTDERLTQIVESMGYETEPATIEDFDKLSIQE